MKNICFFNHWHNGDVFAGKGWVQDIMRQLPNLKFAYAHVNNSKIIQDLNAEYFHCDDLPDGLVDKNKMAVAEDEIYVNTWIGSYGWDVIPRGEEHANWLSLHKMFTAIYNDINTHNGTNLYLSSNPLDYVSSTDFSKFDTSAADAFLQTHSGKRIHLVCNGFVRSQQSKLDTMQSIIEKIADENINDIFICTAKFHTERGNIHFTDVIFNMECDINEIAYLSTKCSVIAGKNSGPYMFCHIKENIFDPAKSFVSLSHRASDCYPYNLTGFKCHYYHCSSEQDDQVVQAIKLAIDELGTPSSGIVDILT